jgi:hypothetical protein
MTIRLFKKYKTQRNLSSKLSDLQKYRINLLLVFLVFYPFISIFKNIDMVFPSLNLSDFMRVFNYGGVIGYGYLFLRQKVRISHNLSLILVVLLGMLVLNYLLTPMASTKWFFNWIGFIFVGFMIVQTVSSLSDLEIQLLKSKSLNIVLFMWIVLILLVSYVWFENWNEIVTFLLKGWYNHVIYRFSINIGIEKQALGVFSFFCIVFSLMTWSSFPKTHRFFCVVFFITMIPMMIGIRTLWLCLILCSVWGYVIKHRSRLFGAYMIGLVFFFILILNFSELSVFFSKYYDRLPSLKFAINEMMTSIFGFGNGGHHFYVEENMRELVFEFGSVQMKENQMFNIAPESDLVYFIGSWGIFSAVFFGFFVHVLLKAGMLFHRCPEITSIERVILMMAVGIIFMGISQDFAGSLIWWVLMASGYGVILRHKTPFLKSVSSKAIIATPN